MMILLFLGSLNCFPSQIAMKESESLLHPIVCDHPGLEKFTLPFENADSVTTILKKKFRSPRVAIASGGSNVILVFGMRDQIKEIAKEIDILSTTARYWDASSVRLRAPRLKT
jgi:hypothetical protein